MPQIYDLLFYTNLFGFNKSLVQYCCCKYIGDKSSSWDETEKQHGETNLTICKN